MKGVAAQFLEALKDASGLQPAAKKRRVRRTKGAFWLPNGSIPNLAKD
jgi:hypothetical protein